MGESSFVPTKPQRQHNKRVFWVIVLVIVGLHSFFLSPIAIAIVILISLVRERARQIMLIAVLTVLSLPGMLVVLRNGRTQVFDEATNQSIDRAADSLSALIFGSGSLDDTFAALFTMWSHTLILAPTLAFLVVGIIECVKESIMEEQEPELRQSHEKILASEIDKQDYKLYKKALVSGANKGDYGSSDGDKQGYK